MFHRCPTAAARNMFISKKKLTVARNKVSDYAFWEALKCISKFLVTGIGVETKIAKID